MPRGRKPGQVPLDDDDLRSTRKFKLACRKLARKEVSKLAPSEKKLAMLERRERFREEQLERIGKAYTDCIADGVKPTYAALVERTGMSLMTIRRHLEKLTLGDARTKVKAAAESILNRLAQRALSTGDERAVESYFKLMFDWKDGSNAPTNNGPISINIDTQG